LRTCSRRGSACTEVRRRSRRGSTVRTDWHLGEDPTSGSAAGTALFPGTFVPDAGDPSFSSGGRWLLRQAFCHSRIRRLFHRARTPCAVDDGPRPSKLFCVLSSQVPPRLVSFALSCRFSSLTHEFQGTSADIAIATSAFVCGSRSAGLAPSAKAQSTVSQFATAVRRV
jgi:hypothetical protein